MVQFPTNQANRSDSIRILTAAAEEERERMRRRGEGLLLLYSKVAYIPHRRQTDDPAGRYGWAWGGCIITSLTFHLSSFPLTF
ncbi:uncharacterized protein LAJ45_01262 [Morchella importuna]|uniref:uncharacterized protein n=1 Tax=Morchella importuna TaxID=1174673 RepID=UPI001E8E52D7|nr:uncharacterized protein LAJ45_01262 [Morchella importuna]KAH8154731.1 hypothetical protein LAJ45_01262 [Morchella importuna]